MPNLAENISGTLELAGVTDSTSYPNCLGRTGRIINQVARMMMREARLGDQNQYLQFKKLSSPGREQIVGSILDPNSICTVEIQSDQTSDSRIDIDIVSRTDLNIKEQNGQRAVARFGSPTRLRFSWDPSLSNDTVYVGYEALPEDATDRTSIPNLPESFHDCLQYRSAALVRETLMGKECGQVFLDTMERVEGQWSQWCKRDAEERPTVKPGFGSLDYGDPMEGTWW